MAEIAVQVCYAEPDKVFLKTLHVAQDACVQQAIEQSGVLRDVPGLDLRQCRVGIYGKVKPLDAPLREGDRIEIYRPLVVDPMEARRRRAAHKARPVARAARPGAAEPR